MLANQEDLWLEVFWEPRDECLRLNFGKMYWFLGPIGKVAKLGFYFEYSDAVSSISEGRRNYLAKATKTVAVTLTDSTSNLEGCMLKYLAKPARFATAKATRCPSSFGNSSRKKSLKGMCELSIPRLADSFFVTDAIVYRGSSIRSEASFAKRVLNHHSAWTRS